ncbi:MAG: ATP-binding protein [Clostridiales bacterium]|nr:ATP-binding protein [Clostridiales bacterium]MCF8022653.1 ATP-binding protein [Clostridiales bacterium]
MKEIVNQEELNLTKYCLTFPKIPDKEIWREVLLRQISSMFSGEQQTILIKGISGSGKTVLLSQFARYFSDRTFSFFVGDDYWSSDIYSFLIDICEQMFKVNYVDKGFTVW